MNYECRIMNDKLRGEKSPKGKNYSNWKIIMFGKKSEEVIF